MVTVNYFTYQSSHLIEFFYYISNPFLIYQNI